MENLLTALYALRDSADALYKANTTNNALGPIKGSAQDAIDQLGRNLAIFCCLNYLPNLTKHRGSRSYNSSNR